MALTTGEDHRGRPCPRPACGWPALALFLLAGPAAAQDHGAAAGEQDEPPEAVITGSLLPSSGPPIVPVTIIDREAIAASGQVSLGALLNARTDAATAAGRATNLGGDGTVRLSLRGLGAQRTLVLVNGRRWVPGGSGADASVDLDTLPASAVERVEVLEAGGAAAHGADAIGGVVNVVTRRGRGGGAVEATAGASSRGDAATYRVDATWAAGGERGSALLSASFAREGPIWAGDRGWSAPALRADYRTAPPTVTTVTSSNVPNGLLRVDLADCGASVLCQELAAAFGAGVRDLTWTGNTAVNHGYAVYAPATDAYDFAAHNYLSTPSERYALFSSGDHRLGDAARAYFEAAFTNRRTGQRYAPVPLGVDLYVPGGISAASQYNPFGQDLLVARSRLVNLSNRTFSQDVDTTRLVAGLDGTAHGWSWDAAYVFGRTAGTDTASGLVRIDLLAAALGPSQGGVCYAGYDPATGAYSSPIPGCTPLDLAHGPAPASQLAGIALTSPTSGRTQQETLTASVRGGLFRLASEREIALAAGAEHRRDSGHLDADPIGAAGLASEIRWRSLRGRLSVTELFGELALPILAGVPWVEDLEASAAVRWSGSDTWGAARSALLGLRYRPLRDLTFRGAWSTAFRPPSIGELFEGNSEAYPSLGDPCAFPASAAVATQCGAAAGNRDLSTKKLAVVGGNPDLRPETATILTAGLLLEPRWLPGLAISLDAFETRVRGVVDRSGPAGTGAVLAGCYPGADGTGAPRPRSQADCARIQRDPTTQWIVAIDARNQNDGERHRSGLDLSLRWALAAARLGRLDLTVATSYVLADDWLRPDGSLVRGAGTYDLAQADPRLKAAWLLRWGGLQGLSASVGGRYLGGFRECGDASGASGPSLCADTPTFFHEVSPSWTWSAGVGYAHASRLGVTSLMLAARNLFDQRPPRIFNAPANAADPAYDAVGRFISARLGHDF